MSEPEREIIFCPRARSDWTPCIARDGALALADDGVCVGCGHQPSELLKDLALRHEPARRYLQTRSPEKLADRLREQVAEYVEATDERA